MLRYIIFILICIACGLVPSVTSQTLVQLSETVRITKGDNVSLDCRLQNLGSSAAIVIWYHDNSVVSFKEDLASQDIRYKLVTSTPGLWRISIQRVMLRDEGEWRCSATVGTQEQQTKTILFVKTPPEIVAKTTQTVWTPRLGMSFQLFCNASGSPTPTITWMRQSGAEGIILPDGTTTEYVIGTTLQFANVTEMHHGTYGCRATNGLRYPAESSFRVQIPYTPVAMTRSNVVRAPRNLSTDISCTVRSYPQITSVSSVRWVRNGVNVVNGQNQYSYNLNVKSNDVEESISVLSLPGVDDTVTGEYDCQFTNSRGTGSTTITLQAGPAIMNSEYGAVRSAASTLLAGSLALLITSVAGFLIGQN